jgi:hypothetical protein
MAMGFWCSIVVLVQPQSFSNSAHGGTKMNQNAKRNLQRRKRQATRLSQREYFKSKKEAALKVPAEAKPKAA